MKPTLKHTIRLVLSHIGRSDPRVTWGTFPSGHDCGPWAWVCSTSGNDTTVGTAPTELEALAYIYTLMLVGGFVDPRNEAMVEAAERAEQAQEHDPT